MGMGLNGINAEGWIPPAEDKNQVDEMLEDMWKLLETIDTFILGRKTFQFWENYWPFRADDPNSSDFQKNFQNLLIKFKKSWFQLQ